MLLVLDEKYPDFDDHKRVKPEPEFIEFLKKRKAEREAEDRKWREFREKQRREAQRIQAERLARVAEEEAQQRAEDAVFVVQLRAVERCRALGRLYRLKAKARQTPK